MRPLRIVLLGFGTVARGLSRLLMDGRGELLAQHGFDPMIVGVATASRGVLHRPEGLDLSQLLEISDRGQSLLEYDASDLDREWDALRLLRESEAEVVCELTPTDLDAPEDAIERCRLALTHGRHVVSANKAPVALGHDELQREARENGVRLLMEATVLAGTPVFSLARSSLGGTRIQSIRGILNGTTNFMLGRIESGSDYAEALERAQQLGYAETDPTADVEGHDVVAKLSILAASLMGQPIHPREVERRGITDLDPGLVQDAPSRGAHWKLVGEIRRGEGRLEACVAPRELPGDDPLCRVHGANNAICFETDALGPVTVTGRGAGGRETGFGVLNDLLEINRVART